ncbi:L-Aspartase-like protein [Pisolithus croceorrhizus]|nr:L-Aspartase-like protein [Pisolithus croceorrhizus]
MSDIFRNILSHQEVAAIWSDAGRTSFYLEFERALALVQADLGIIPREAADAIADFCSDVSNVDFEDLRVQTEKIGYPVLGLIKQIVHHVNAKAPGYGEWAHWGATTQDVTDTATVLQLRQTVDIITSSLDAIIINLRNLADIYKATPMAARSNLQQAVPITFGFKLARLLCTFQRHHERLLQLKHRLFVLQFGGAAGTLATLPADKALKCQAALAQALKLAPPEIAWHTERDRFAELAGFFALLTGTCAKFALDTKLLMQSEIGEVSEPFYEHRGSSSTMPQKRNPISCAYVSAIATAVRQHATAICEAMVADHERSTGPWEVEWIILPEICTLSGAALKHTQELVAGLQVHPEAMMKNLNITKGGIVAEAVMMGLAPQIGRQVAHDVVYELCRQSAEKNVDLLHLLRADERVMSGGLSVEQLEQLCDPKNYLGLSVEMVERVLGYQ